MTSAEMSRPGSAHTRPESGPLKMKCRPFSWPTCASTGSMRDLELLLQLILQLLDLRLRVLGEALDLDLQPLDLLLHVGLRRRAHHRGFLLELAACSAWSCLFFSFSSARLLCCSA